MLRICSVAAIAVLLGLSGLFAGAAQAVQRTHVSAAFGADANTATNCTAVAPCRFFQAAMTVTDTNGEVVVLDSGGYGAVTIAQSVSLIAPPGVYAGISVFPAAFGVTIATAGVDVTLRGITINSQGGGVGIYMSAGASLTVENCVITNFSGSGYGIYVDTAATVGVRDTALRNNYFGIYLDAGVTATIARTTVAGIAGSGFSIYVHNATAGTTTSAAITDTTLSGGYGGIYGHSPTSATANVRVSVIRSTVTKYLHGIAAQSDAGAPVVVTVSETMVTNNLSYGLNQYGTGAALRSLGNNTLDQNNSDTSGTITTVLPM